MDNHVQCRYSSAEVLHTFMLQPLFSATTGCLHLNTSTKTTENWCGKSPSTQPANYCVYHHGLL